MVFTVGNWGLQGYAPSGLSPIAICNVLVEFFFGLFSPPDAPQGRYIVCSVLPDTFGSHILIQCCREELIFFKISKSNALTHGFKYPGKQFIQVIIISAGHFWSQNLEVIFQDKQLQLPCWGYQHLCCCQQMFCSGSCSLVAHICLLHAHLLYLERSQSFLALPDSIASCRMNSGLSQYLHKKGAGSIHLASCRRSGHLKDFVGPENSAALPQEIAKLLDNCGYVLLCEIGCIF